MVEALEAGVLRAIGPIAEAVCIASDEVAATRDDLESIQSHVSELAIVGRGAALKTGALARSTEHLAASAAGINGAMDQATVKIDEAVACAHDANSSMAELAKAGDEIVGMLDTIMAVARQTNLLALNATIESARAGAAGWDLAVVAHEVKTLSAETSHAANHIRGLIERLRESAGSSIAAVGKIVSVVDDVQPVFGAVRAAVDVQTASIADLAQRAAEASAGVDWVSGRVQEVDGVARNAGSRVAQADEAAVRAENLATRFGPRFVTGVRQSQMGDRRQHDRFPADLRVVVRSEGRDVVSTTVDIGQGGLLLARTDGIAPLVGASLDLEVEGIGPIMGRVVGIGPMGIHVCFGSLGAETQSRVARLIAEIEDGYSAPIKIAQDAARRVERTLEQAVAHGMLTREELFDTSYREILGSDPQQYETVYLKVFEDVLPAILEPLLLSDSSMAFCNLIDRNGYTPVHNRKYTHAQRPGDAGWNTAHCLNKRMDNDHAGIVAARSLRPFLVQSYAHDMGGLTVMILEVDAPIRPFDCHWGGFRTGYRL